MDRIELRREMTRFLSEDQYFVTLNILSSLSALNTDSPAFAFGLQKIKKDKLLIIKFGAKIVSIFQFQSSTIFQQRFFIFPNLQFPFNKILYLFFKEEKV